MFRTDQEKSKKEHKSKKGKMGIPLVLRRVRNGFLRILLTILGMFAELVFGWMYKNCHKPLPPITNPILLETGHGLAAKIRSKKLKSEEVVESFIARIKEINPILNVVVDDRFGAALEEARAADRLIASGEKTEATLAKETPFLGVPFTIKDSFKVKGLRQTAGLLIRKDMVAQEDADVIKLMRKAGAIPLAVTNVSELCMWWESNNTVYGRSNNAYHNGRTVGGSSGGEGCLQSAAGSAIGIGSDIGGSIRIPAFMNGVFGHKPSKGIVPNQGQEPPAEGKLADYLCTGPLVRYASDLIPMYKVLAGSNVDKLQLDKKVNVKDIKFYYMEDDGGCMLTSKVHPDIKQSMRKVVQHLDKAYGIKAQKLAIEQFKYSTAIFFTKFSTGAKHSFSEELTLRQGRVNGKYEMVKWLFGLSKYQLSSIGWCLNESVVQTSPEDQANVENERRFTELREELERLLGTDGVFLYPTHPLPAVYHGQSYTVPFNFAYTGIFNLLGLPSTHCPIGLSREGLPVGFQVVGGLNRDHLTIAVACELEKICGGWVCPSQVL